MRTKPVSAALPEEIAGFIKTHPKLLAALAQWAKENDLPNTGSLTIHFNCGGVTALEKREVVKTGNAR